MFNRAVADEERLCDQYDTEVDNMATFGGRYLGLQSTERSKSRAAGQPAE